MLNEVQTVGCIIRFVAHVPCSFMADDLSEQRRLRRPAEVVIPSSWTQTA